MKVETNVGVPNIPIHAVTASVPRPVEYVDRIVMEVYLEGVSIHFTIHPRRHLHARKTNPLKPIVKKKTKTKTTAMLRGRRRRRRRVVARMSMPFCGYNSILDLPPNFLTPYLFRVHQPQLQTKSATKVFMWDVSPLYHPSTQLRSSKREKALSIRRLMVVFR